MIIYLDKNKKPNVVCDGDSVLTDILEGENIIIERNLKNKTITISSDATKNIMESIKAGENITIEHDKNNKTLTINSDAKNETINNIKAGDNIVIIDDGAGGVTVNTLIDILDKNPANPKPGYMWILNNSLENPDGSGSGTGGSGSSGETGSTEGNTSVVADGTFACFDEAGNFYCSEDTGNTWQKRGKIECDSGVYPAVGIALGNNTIVTATVSQLHYSNDGGNTWNKCTQSVYSYIHDIQYINGKFYACCGSAVSPAPAPAVLLVSNNGITWKTALQKYNNSLFIFQKIQYINNMYFLFACQMTGSGSKLLYSQNGSTWTESTGDNGIYPLLPMILFNGTFYIVTRTDNFETYTSTDGKKWTTTGEKIIDTGLINRINLTTLEEINGKFYAVFINKGIDGVSGKAISSSDGIKWDNTALVITIDISSYLEIYNNMSYHLETNGNLLSSESFAPWKIVGTVPLENPGHAYISCFSVLQR